MIRLLQSGAGVDVVEDLLDDLADGTRVLAPVLLRHLEDQAFRLVQEPLVVAELAVGS